MFKLDDGYVGFIILFSLCTRLKVSVNKKLEIYMFYFKTTSKTSHAGKKNKQEIKHVLPTEETKQRKMQIFSLQK